MRSALLMVILPSAIAQTWVMQSAPTSASLRGVSVVNERVVWASGTGGTFLRTVDGGNTWNSASVPGAETLDFRGVHAFSAAHAILMSSGEGAMSSLWETEDSGRTWQLLFRNPDLKGFFDALAFDDSTHGALLGDPVNGIFALFLTADGGHTWKRIPTPPALQSESAFAASNTSLVIRHCTPENRCEISFATGGLGAARIFFSPDALHWTMEKTPIRNDSPGAGVFSLAGGPEGQRVAVGGDYAKPGEAAHVVAVSADRQKSRTPWSEPSGAQPRGYRSSVAYLRDRKVWITTGPNGSEVSRNKGQDWSPIDNGSFNAIGGSKTQACWAVGPKGRIARLKF